MKEQGIQSALHIYLVSVNNISVQVSFQVWSQTVAHRTQYVVTLLMCGCAAPILRNMNSTSIGFKTTIRCELSTS